MKKRSFAMALGKDDPHFEMQFHSRVMAGRGQLPNAKQLASMKGVIRKGKALFFNQRMMSRDMFGMLGNTSALAKTARGVTRKVDERLALARQLKELGHKIAIAHHFRENLISSRRLKLAKQSGRLVKAELPIRDQIGTKKEVHPNIMWMRDVWKKVGKKRINFFKGNGVEEDFGEGGMSVDLPGKRILASKDLASNPEVQKLQAQGYQFHFLGDGYQFKPNLTKILKTKIYSSTTHIDLFVGVIGKTMLVDPAFYKNNRGELRRAAKEAGLEIVFVPDKETDLHPANILPLEENSALVDKDAKGTIALLRSKGVHVVPTCVSIRANRAAGGGVRCIINEI
jgi:hypothetical protein